jgi:hypothetical protein
LDTNLGKLITIRKDFMNKLSWFLVISIVVFLSGCGETSSIVIKPGQGVIYKGGIIKKPDIGIVSEAKVGESMISTYLMQIVPVLVLENDIAHEAKWRGRTNIIAVEKGNLRLTSRDSEGRFFSGIVYWKNANNKKIEGGIYLNDDESKAPKLFFIYDLSGKSLTEELPSVVSLTLLYI